MLRHLKSARSKGKEKDKSDEKIQGKIMIRLNVTSKQIKMQLI